MKKYVIILLLPFILSACSSGPGYANKVVNIADLDDRSYRITSDYKIGVGDILQINVWRNPDLGATVPVRPDGKISAPLVGDVLVAGLTPEDVAQDITDRLSKFVRAPSVAIIMTGLSSTDFISRVRVTGAVEESISIQHSQGMTILDAVLSAGGPNEFADSENVKLFRRLNDETVLIPINLNSILVEGNLLDNIVLIPGDTITIPEKIF